jgi:hypothetical protein
VTSRITYPPHVLREYSLLADGERGALVGPRGDICWMCAPRWESDAVFATLIGGAGVYAITPVEQHVWGGYYEPGSLIWRNRWITTSGIIECRDALAYPGDRHRAVLLRRVMAVEGDARVDVALAPHAGFGQASLVRIHSDQAAGTTLWTARTGSLQIRWSGPTRVQVTGTGGQRRLTSTETIPAGRYRDFLLEISDAPLGDPLDPEQMWRGTENTWTQTVPPVTSGRAPTAARHSYAVLHGLTSSSGGMVAAATTSLPERAEAGRNYDYRYAWIRDQCYTGQAVATAAGPPQLLDDAVRYVTDRVLEHGPKLAPAYCTDGSPVPDQRQLDLPGYPGGYDLVGNWVNRQFQLDAVGEVLLLLASAARADRLDGERWHAIEVAADVIAKRWPEPDAGIWELGNRPWTHSRLIAAAGLRAVAAIRPTSGESSEWLALADRLVADTSARALAPDGHWQRSPDDPGLDASLLLPGLRGAVPSDDPRTVATLDAYRADLTQAGYAYRFRHGDGPLGEAEGAFLICGFWMAQATLQQGRHVEATGWFERTRAACGPPMLFSEEYDAKQNQMRGNLPQAFVHALLIETSAVLEGDEEPRRSGTRT